jgi:beta-lactamase class A
MPQRKKKLHKQNKLKPVILGLITAGLIFLVGFKYFQPQGRENSFYKPILIESWLPSQATPEVARDIEYKKDEFKEFLDFTQSVPGTYAVYVKDLRTGEVLAANEELSFYGASLYKVPIAVALIKEIERGNVFWDQTEEYLEIDYYGGSGRLQFSEIGTEFTMEEILRELLTSSDNVAQNILLRTLPRPTINEAFSYAPDNAYYADNITSPLVMGTYFENLYHSSYISRNNLDLMLNLMSNTLFDDRISVYLKPGLSFSHKIGNWPDTGSWHDCGIVYDGEGSGMVVCLMSENATFEDFLLVGQRLAETINEIF